MVENQPKMQETWVWSQGWEDPLEKEMATHSSILAWKISRTEKPGRLQSIGSQSQTRRVTNTHTRSLLIKFILPWAESILCLVGPIRFYPLTGSWAPRPAVDLFPGNRSRLSMGLMVKTFQSVKRNGSGERGWWTHL